MIGEPTRRSIPLREKHSFLQESISHRFVHCQLLHILVFLGMKDYYFLHQRGCSRAIFQLFMEVICG